MIRFAVSDDIPSIMGLLHQVNDVHACGRPDLFSKGHTKYSEKEISEIISDPMAPVFIFSDENGNVLAYCFCLVQDHTNDPHLKPVKTLYIDDLCVDERCRGMHIGKQMYEYVKEWAGKNGFYNITLNVWECNRAAARFYESMGLIPQKTTLEAILS